MILTFDSAYGLVYKAIHKETHQTVAIKQFKESEEDELVIFNLEIGSQNCYA